MSEMDLNVETVDCPCCGPASYTVWMEQKDRTRYIKCHGCGTVYASPRASHASRYAWIKDTFALEDSTLKITENRRPALALEANLLAPFVHGGNLLDVGCSTGAFFNFFDSSLWQKYGVELSPSTAAYAAKKYNADVRAGTLEAACFSPGFFDLITMIDMFYYEDDPRALLQEAARVIRPDGLLVIELPGLKFHQLRGKGVISWLLDRTWSRFNSRSGYLNWYSPAGIEKLLNQTGFDIFQWKVIGAPKRSGLSQVISSAYFQLMRNLVTLWPGLITWAPKYLLIAKTRKTGAISY